MFGDCFLPYHIYAYLYAHVFVFASLSLYVYIYIKIYTCIFMVYVLCTYLQSWAWLYVHWGVSRFGLAGLIVNICNTKNGDLSMVFPMGPWGKS